MTTLAPARRRSPIVVRDLLLVSLSVSSGAVDAISFLALGKVFTAFMTGNIVFLGVGVSGAGGPDVPRALIAIGAFAVGVYGATRLIDRETDSGVWPRRVSPGGAPVGLVAAGWSVLWAARRGPP